MPSRTELVSPDTAARRILSWHCVRVAGTRKARRQRALGGVQKAAPTTTPLDSPSAWKGVALDITEGKRAEEALRRSEARFRLLLENSSDGIALCGADGAILYESPSVVRVTAIRRS